MTQFNGFKAKEMTTAQARDYIRRYENSTCYSVENAYKNPTPAKRLAEEYIKIRMDKAGVFGFRILGASRMEFSAGYMIGDEKCVYLIVETHYNIYCVELER